MNVNELANWMMSTWVYDLLIANESWIWPALEASHFFGMCLLFGALIVVDLRLFGWAKIASVANTDKLAPIAMIGFIINFVTGILFLFGDPMRYFTNISFYIKMGFIVLAALNFALYKVKIAHLVENIQENENTPLLAKISGAASLILWLGVLCFGRLIPYLEVQEF
jgi:hypothetical protein